MFVAGCGRFGFGLDPPAKVSADAIVDAIVDAGADAGTAVQTIFGDATPPGYAMTDTSAIEVGVLFQSDVAGTVSAVRFYRNIPTANGYVVHLWSDTGQLLALGSAATDPDPTPGWQRVDLTPSLPIAAKVTYVASYVAATGQYAVEQHEQSGIVQSGDLAAVIDGVFHYGLGDTYPVEKFGNSNYFVDVEFRAIVGD